MDSANSSTGLELSNSATMCGIPASDRFRRERTHEGARELRELPGPAVEDIDLASVMHALADPSRLRTVSILAESPELCCSDLGELTRSLGLAKSTRSHHLRVLREAGVITTRYDGQRKLVSLRKDDLDARFPGLVDAVLGGARSELARVAALDE
jgi:DNA-binding transcriptional ArsR family regulator